MHPDWPPGGIPNSHKNRPDPSIPDLPANGGTFPRTTAANTRRIGFSFFLRPHRQAASMNFRFWAVFAECRQRMGPMFPCFHPPSPTALLQPCSQTPHQPVPHYQFIKVANPNLRHHVLLKNSKEPFLGKPVLLQPPSPLVACQFLPMPSCPP